MTKKEALKRFKETAQGLNVNDKPALGEAWCRYIDNLHRSKEITQKQVETWDNPFNN